MNMKSIFFIPVFFYNDKEFSIKLRKKSYCFFFDISITNLLKSLVNVKRLKRTFREVGIPNDSPSSRGFNFTF